MSLKAWFKSNATDRVLMPLRKELVELIDDDSSLLEVGCGTGDLLFQCASKISNGHGVDIDPGMIRYAETKRQKDHQQNLSFECIDALAMAPRAFDISTTTLCLHALPEQQACALLKLMVDHSKKVLVADFTECKTVVGRWGTELDELISGHYRNYRQYRRNGEVPFYAEKAGAVIVNEIASAIDGISIWCVKKGLE